MIPNWNQFYPYAVELNVEAADYHEVTIQNPGYQEGKPVFSFGYSSEPAKQRFKKIEAGEKGNRVERQNLQRLRKDLLKDIEAPVSRGQAEKQIEQLTADLRAEGNTVYLTDMVFGLKCWGYVVELEEGAAQTNKMQDANPDWKGKLPPFYVGMTSKSPSERFDAHKNGNHGNQLVKQYGLTLRPDLFQHINKDGLTSWEAEELEVQIAEELREEGYAVFQR